MRRVVCSVFVCVCVYMRVYIILLATTRVKGLRTNVYVCILLSAPPFCIWKESGDKPSVDSSRMLGVRHCYCRTWM